MADVPLQEAIRVAVRIATGDQTAALDLKTRLEQHQVVEKSVAALVASSSLLLRTVRVLGDKELEEYLSIGFEGLLLGCVYLQSRVGRLVDTDEGRRELLTLLGDFGARGPKAARAMAAFVNSSKITS